mgnify:CR=1 FL=1
MELFGLNLAKRPNFRRPTHPASWRENPHGMREGVTNSVRFDVGVRQKPPQRGDLDRVGISHRPISDDAGRVIVLSRVTSPSRGEGREVQGCGAGGETSPFCWCFERQMATLNEAVLRAVGSNHTNGQAFFLPQGA